MEMPGAAAPTHGKIAPTITLEDRYVRERGAVYLNGLQALVRLPIDQARRDRRAGLRIGVVLSGEDHDANSSTVPVQDDSAFVRHGMTIVFPSSVAECLTLGLHTIALS